MKANNLIHAKIHAANLAFAAEAAYWTRDGTRDYLTNKVREEFRMLADAMGFDIIERPHADDAPSIEDGAP